MKKWKIILPIVVVISFLLSCVSVNAQVNNGNNENDWFAQHKLIINVHQEKRTFSSNGVDKAEMHIEIKNKITDQLAEAQSDITVLLDSDIGILKPQKVTIVKNDPKSEDISLTSTDRGIDCITAQAARLGNATARVEFKRPPDPCGLLLTALPNESVLADGMHPTTLTVKLLNSDNEPIKPLLDKYIDIGTNKGEKIPQIIIYREKLYGQGNFTTYKSGNHTITAKSHDFNLEDSTVVTFISPITLLTLFFAVLGGFCAGIIRYFQDIKGKIFIPKKIDGTFYFGFVLNLFLYSLFGTVIFAFASFNIPGTNFFNIPIDIGRGAFVIGFIGGFFFFAIINVYIGYVYIKRKS